MKDIIIVGTGKAALLHFNSYNKLGLIGNIYFVDIKDSSKYFNDIKIYSSIRECILLNELDVNNLIVDICTPKSEFYRVIDECILENIKDILVEKPFVIDGNYDKYNSLNIVMVENYLYSKVTKYIKKYLVDNDKKINLIYTNFSKNRVSDSLNKRGYIDCVTMNYEIEMPHQIYLTQYFLDDTNDFSTCITCSRDMNIDGVNLVNHGYGLIIAKSNDVDIIYESNLASLITQKRVIVSTRDNYTIEGNYALYTSDLKLLKKANVNIFLNGELIDSILIDEDDNFTYFMKEAYDYFNGKSNNPNLVSIKNFSFLMNNYCSNLLFRKSNKDNG